MPKLGIIGYPNTGKTTLFNALTGLEALTAPHPYTTTQPNRGVALIPDPALDRVAEVERSKKVVYAGLEVLDLPAFDRPDTQTRFSGQYLARLREMEAIVAVLRTFPDPSVPSVTGGHDPVEQAEELLLELLSADHEVFSRRVPRIRKEASSQPSLHRTVEAIERAADWLASGRRLSEREWDDVSLAAFRDMSPLTLLPVLWILNLPEDGTDRDELQDRVTNALTTSSESEPTVLTLSAQLEAEGAQLDPDERRELLTAWGWGEGALAQMVRAAFQALGLNTFYTVGPKESHAWTVAAGATAAEAAGKIHSDMERGFIRAEICPLSTVIQCGGWDAAKKNGKVRLEGKEYRLASQEVMLVRFSV